MVYEKEETSIAIGIKVKEALSQLLAILTKIILVNKRIDKLRSCL